MQSLNKKLLLFFILFLILLPVISFAQSAAPADTVSTGKPGNTPSPAVFMPIGLPTGWESASGLLLYGTADNPAADGTIFDYINGGGVVYVDHGLVALAHKEFLRTGSPVSLVIDIFDMGTPQNAFRTFSDDIVCPDGYSVNQNVPGSKAYNYAPDYLLYFQGGRYLVYCGLTDDTEHGTLETIASSIQKMILMEVKHETVN